MNFQFAWPWLFLCLPLPWLAWRFAPPARTRGAGAIRVPFFAEITPIDGDARAGPSRGRLAFMILLWCLLLCAAARPQWLGDLDRLAVSGRNLMMAVDISGSMKTADLELDGKAADRLSVVKSLGAQFLERRIGDRVGLVLFGTNAYLQAPLTFDRRTVGTLLEEAVIGMAGERTAIGDAIGLAIKRLRQVGAEHRVLLLLTDGANTAGSVDPAEAARLAASAGLTVYTIGIGAERMRVNSLFGMREVNPSVDLDEALLREIAERTGGRYFRARSAEGLDEVYRVLDEIEPVPQPDRDARRVAEWFHWPLAAALLMLLGALLRAVGGPRAMGALNPSAVANRFNAGKTGRATP